MKPPLSLEEFPATSYEEWRASAEESLKGAPFDKKLVTATPEGIKLQPIYRKEDLAALQLPETWPGVAPYVRGGRAAGFKGTSWLVAQELPVSSAEEFNVVLKSELMRGQNATTILPDVATRHAVDPDTVSPSDVGHCGLSLATKDDAATALNGIDLTAAPLLVFAGASALPLAALLASATSAEKIAGAILADPLTEWARDGILPLGLQDAYAEMAAVTRWGAAHSVRTVGIQANLWADAGGTAVEELAFAIATASDYFRALAEDGVDAGTVAAGTVMALSIGSDLFMQIAKLRAARLLWSNLLSAYGAPPTPLFIHARSGIFNKSTLDPHTNMLRATSEAFSAVIGGADSLHVAAYDETLRAPDEFSRRIARNVHTVLAEECGFSEVADAAGGSWFVESLTLELAKKAWSLFQDVEARGGMAAALIDSFPQQTVAKSAAARLDAVSKRKTGIIGVNLFPNPSEKPLAHSTTHPDFFTRRAADVRSQRTAAPESIERTVEAATAAFQAGASIGAVSKALPRHSGPAAQIERVRVIRAAQGYEALRAAARANPPLVWLAKFGPPKQSKARADFSAGFFAAGGYKVKQSPLGASSVEQALEDAVAANPRVVVVCSTDDTYPEIVPAFVPALKARLPDLLVILAGFPADQVDAHKASGVNDFIHLKVDCLAFLQDLHHKLGL